ncbi:MAG: NAD(P)/FAD-dependent oxidoreductase [Trueperaceae bacterium]|nr:NAD(P)/FAD-dependent oxidoreductase [Trueperaceae bacterium]
MSGALPDRADVVVVGAGLAGLTAARELRRGGRTPLVLEAGDRVGGRVTSDVLPGGFVLDRGFQVLFPAYPSYVRHLGRHGPRLVHLPPSAVLRDGGGPEETVGDPVRDPAVRRRLLRLHALPPLDLLRLGLLAAEVVLLPPALLLTGPDESARAFLTRRGFSDAAVQRFFVPFFGGVFLERELRTSARQLRYVLRMLLLGGVARPEGGMRRIGEALAEGLDVHLETPVAQLDATPEGGVRVALANGGALHARDVVVATPPPEAARLSGAAVPPMRPGGTYLAFDAPAAAAREPRLMLGDGDPVGDATWTSALDPSLAPPGRALLSVTVLPDADPVPSDPSVDRDAALEGRVRATLRRWFGPDADAWPCLATYRIPDAQTDQPPGMAGLLASVRTPLAHVWLASEATRGSSIQAAMEAGEQAAAAILGDAAVLGRPRGA